MSQGIAHVTLVGNLTRDPELRQTPSGVNVCGLGVAVNSSIKNSAGEWSEKANFFEVTVFGAKAEVVARYMSKGRQVAIDGRLDYQSWEAQDGSKRSKVVIIADTVMFIGPRDAESGDRQPERQQQPVRSGARQQKMDAGDDFRDINFGDQDDIPF